jgi:hypothetical protein
MWHEIRTVTIETGTSDPWLLKTSSWAMEEAVAWAAKA